MLAERRITPYNLNIEWHLSNPLLSELALNKHVPKCPKTVARVQQEARLLEDLLEARVPGPLGLVEGGAQGVQKRAERLQRLAGSENPSSLQFGSLAVWALRSPTLRSPARPESRIGGRSVQPKSGPKGPRSSEKKPVSYSKHGFQTEGSSKQSPCKSIRQHARKPGRCHTSIAQYTRQI